MGTHRLFLGVLLALAAFVACGDDDAPTDPTPSAGVDGGGDGGGDGEASTPNDAGVDSTTPASAMVLDPAFGTGGKTTIPVGGSDLPTPIGIVAQSTGGIVVAGSAFNADGKGTASLFRLTNAGALEGAAQSTDVIAGQLVGGPGVDTPFLFGSPLAAPGSPVVLRFLAAGTPDSSFGTGGRSEKGSGGGIPVVLANGKIEIGLSGGANVTRLDAKGDLDPTWGGSSGPLTGIASILPITHYEFRALGPLSDGRLLVGGGVGDSDTKPCAVIRLGTDGALDKAFGEVPVSSTCSVVRGIFPNADGSFLVEYVDTSLGLALTRFTAAGAKDDAYKTPTDIAGPLAVLRRTDDHLLAFAFGTAIKKLALWDIGPTGSVVSARTFAEAWGQNVFMAQQSDGKLVVVAVLANALVVARYLP